MLLHTISTVLYHQPRIAEPGSVVGSTSSFRITQNPILLVVEKLRVDLKGAEIRIVSGRDIVCMVYREIKTREVNAGSSYARNS